MKLPWRKAKPEPELKKDFPPGTQVITVSSFLASPQEWAIKRWGHSDGFLFLTMPDDKITSISTALLTGWSVRTITDTVESVDS
jgi:hypothetical protein